MYQVVRGSHLNGPAGLVNGQIDIKGAVVEHLGLNTQYQLLLAFSCTFFIQEKTEHAIISFGSPAIFDRKILCFPSPPHGGFGFLGCLSISKDFYYPLFEIIVALVPAYIK